MLLRSLGLSLALVFWGFVPSQAEQPSGLPTLDNLLGSEDATATDASAAEPKRPAEGSHATPLVRPKDGFKHPDLDKGWAEYRAAVAKASEPLKAAIIKQFEAATTKGDLDTASKWQALLQKLEKECALPPAEGAVKPTVVATKNNFEKAKKTLLQVYDGLKEGLTKDAKIADAQQIADATQVQTERDGLDQKEKEPAKPAKKLTDAEIIRKLQGTRWRFQDGKMITLRADGTVDKSWGTLHPEWQVRNGKLYYESKEIEFSPDFQFMTVTTKTGKTDIKGIGQRVVP